MDSRPDEAKVRQVLTTVDISQSDSHPLGDDSGKEPADVLGSPQKAVQDPEPTEPISGMRSHSPAVSSGPREPEAKIRALEKEDSDGFPVPPKVVQRSSRSPVTPGTNRFLRPRVLWDLLWVIRQHRREATRLGRRVVKERRGGPRLPWVIQH